MKTNFEPIFALLLVLASPLARAAEPETVIVPYDPKKPLAGQQPDQLYLGYERFLQLWEAAKQNRRASPKMPAPAPWVLTSARYEGVVGEESVAFKGTLDLLTTNANWVKVPLPVGATKISAMRIDGAPAAFDGKEVVVPQPGRHVLEIAFELPLPRGATRFAFTVPPAAATLVSLTLRDAQARATIAPGYGLIERVAGDRKIVTAAVGETREIRVELLPPAASLRVGEPASAVIRSAVTVRTGEEEVRATVAFIFPGARQDRFTLYLEKDLVLTQLEAQDVKSWRLVAEDDRQLLEITLNQPAEGIYEIALGAHRALPALPLTRAVPQISAAAGRLEESATALFREGRIELTPQPAAGQRQVEWKANAPAGARFVAAFSGAGPLAYRAAPREPQHEARVDYVYQVNRRKIELIASLKLAAKGDDLFGVTLALPADFEVQTVQSPRLQDWWREGPILHVRFKDATPETTPLVVYLVRQYAVAPTELELRPLSLEGFKRVTGEAVIAAHKGVDAALEIEGDAREVAPGGVARDFEILAPLERKRGFTFKTQAFSGQVKLAALPAKWNVLWVLHAQAHEGWVALSARARITLRQGSSDRATFTLPAPLAEARVSGAEVRETRSRVEGDRRIYDVQFQNDVYETVELTVDLDLTNPGSVALPDLTWPGAQLVSGYVLAENASEYEMGLESSGVDPAPKREIPFLPALLRNATIFRVQPGWSVKLTLERLVKAESRTAFVAYAQLVTALRRDGTEWHRATYHLQNRSLQFLPVRLPAGADLMSVRVAGMNVRADAGSVEGRPAILIPLIKTKPGDLSYDVELVYRRKGAPLSWRGTPQLDDPELPGLTVERTLWDVWLPEGHKLTSARGNMEPVLAEVNKTEKLASAVEELKGLANIVSGSSTSAVTRENALGNFYRLKKSIEDDSRAKALEGNAAALGGQMEQDAAVKDSQVQQLQVEDRKREIAQELEEQVRRVDQAAAATPAQGPTRMQSSVGIAAAPQSPEEVAGRKFGINGQNGTAQAGAIGAYQQDAENARWEFNSDYSTPPAPSIAPPAVAAGQLYLNDNVVLQQALPPPAMTAAKPGEKDDSMSKSTDRHGEIAEQQASGEQYFFKRLDAFDARSAAEGGAGKGKANTPQSAAEPQQAMAGTVLNTARGNRAFAQQAPAPLSGPTPGGIPAAPAPSAAAFPDASGLGEVDRDHPGVDNEVRQLKPQGRVSLAVDFPTEGQLFHFKKVKANAELRLSVLKPEAFRRWKAFGAALLGAALLLLAQHVIAGRARRRAIPAV